MRVKIVLATLAFLLFASTGMAYDRACTYIRGCNFKKCKYKTVGESIDEAFERPAWESGKADDGSLIVNVTGIVTWQGKRYNVLMQFAPRPNGFDTNGVAFNGKEMGKEFLSTFVTELCK
ncbi:hypothetical protein [Fundidesulfovibrio terrae]|uniref:hypothetical protein n=1 Tax=Fundidesulfovibrio terrae TaxID=2922866 RepID=UPI001FB008CC|nr:hypothetical protein [Fundidesulfovibrio terrae]